MWTGIRRGELLGLHWQDIDQQAEAFAAMGKLLGG